MSYHRNVLAVLKDLLERQMPTATNTEVDDGGAGESKKRYLILISTVMTWASTKPLDPVMTKLLKNILHLQLCR